MSPLSIVHRSSGGRSRRAMLETLIRHLDMVRLTLGALVVATVFSGCVGIIGDEQSDGLTANQRKARNQFTSKAYAVLVDQCASCHATLQNADFMRGATPLETYDVIKSFDPALLSPIDGTKARLITKGEHSGPAFNTNTKTGQVQSDYETVLDWLRAEQKAFGDVGTGSGSGSGAVTYILSGKITPTVCTTTRASCPVNEITLQGIRPDKSGVDAKVTFIYEVLAASNAPYLVNLQLVGGAEGAYIESPLFLGYVAGSDKPTVDGDAFYGIKTNVAAGKALSIGGGFAGLTDLKATGEGGVVNQIAMSFQVIDKYKPENIPTDPSVCKQVASFVTNVKPILTASCAGCHGVAAGNAGAKGNLLFDPANDAATCQQAKRNASDLTNIPTTGIFLAPKPGANGHPFKLNPSTAWETAVTTWLTAEKNSP
jgi:hypothetical protein